MTPPRRLGSSAIAVSPLGLGTAPLGNPTARSTTTPPPPQAATQLPLAHAPVVSVLVGAERPEQLIEDVGHVGAAISSRPSGALVDEGPLRADAPTPTSLAT